MVQSVDVEPCMVLLPIVSMPVVMTLLSFSAGVVSAVVFILFSQIEIRHERHIEETD